MSKLSKRVKKKLFSIISDMEKNKYQFVKNPNSDFVRTRKLSFSTMMKILISMGGNTLHKELYGFFEFSNDTPTSSAFVQQRSKLLPHAFEFLLHKINHSFAPSRKFKEYRLLAVDGSDIHIPTNSADEASYVCSNENSKGYNLLHLNVLYDLLEKRYEAAYVQKYRKQNERGALSNMIDSSDIADSVCVKQKTRAYVYQINFSEAIHICMAFLRWKRKNPPNVETLIQKNILPVRPDRKDTRKITYKSAVSFIYRVA